MDDKFYDSLSNSVDGGFIDILKQVQREKKQKSRKMSRKKKSRDASRNGRVMRGGEVRGGATTWMQHVRLTAGQYNCSWKEAMKRASRTW